MTYFRVAAWFVVLVLLFRGHAVHAAFCDLNKMGAALKGVLNSAMGRDRYENVPVHELADARSVQADPHQVYPYSPIGIPNSRAACPAEFAGIAPDQMVMVLGADGHVAVGTVIGFDYQGNPVMYSAGDSTAPARPNQLPGKMRILNRYALAPAPIVKMGDILTITYRNSREQPTRVLGVFQHIDNKGRIAVIESITGNEGFVGDGNMRIVRIEPGRVMRMDRGMVEEPVAVAALPALALQSQAPPSSPPVATLTPLVFVDASHLHSVKDDGDATRIDTPQTRISPQTVEAASAVSPRVEFSPQDDRVRSQITAHVITSYRISGETFSLHPNQRVQLRGSSGTPLDCYYLGFHSDGDLAVQNAATGRIHLIPPAAVRSVEPVQVAAIAATVPVAHVNAQNAEVTPSRAPGAAATMVRTRNSQLAGAEPRRTPTPEPAAPTTATADVPREPSLKDELQARRIASLDDWQTPTGNPMWGRRVRFRDALDRSKVYDGYISQVPAELAGGRPGIQISRTRPHEDGVAPTENSATMAIRDSTLHPENISLNGFYIYPNSEPAANAPVPGQTLRFLSQAANEIGAMLSSFRERRLEKIDEDAVYNAHHGVRPIPEEIGERLMHARGVAEYMGLQNRKVLMEAERPGSTIVQGNIGEEGLINIEGWFRMDFDVPRPTDIFKVYIPIAVEHMPRHMAALVAAARKNQAYALKFGRNRKNLQRPDRIVVHFGSASAAAEYALEMARYCQENHLNGDRVPMTHPVGPQGLVSVGVDYAGGRISWRSVVSAVVAEGIAACQGNLGPSCVPIVLKHMRSRDINPDDWLPQNERGDAFRRALAQAIGGIR